MGLDCYIIDRTGDRTFGGGRIGSYSGVHVLRQILINACIKYCYDKIKKTYEELLNIYIENNLIKKALPTHIISTIINYRMNDIIENRYIYNQFDMENIHKVIKLLEESDTEYDDYYEIMNNNELYVDAYNDLRLWLTSPDIKETNASTNNQFGLNGIIDLSKKLSLTLPITDEAINYDNVEQSNLDILNCIGISGIYKFVNHSDSDGSFSFGDCCDIVSMIDKVIIYVDDEKNLEWLNDVKSYYQEAIDVRGILIYC